jgi:hypothetical protein
MPVALIVQVLLTISAGANVPPRANEQLRKVPVAAKTPPIMLTVPKPGGAITVDSVIVVA